MDKPSESDCWHAVETRDAKYDGRFVFGVITTGVYCRPSCSSRRANRENVRFFATCEDAETAGLRACFRCRPLAETRQEKLADQMNKIAQFIKTNADEPLPLSKLSRRFNLSSFYLQRSFKALIGVSPKEYQNAMRLKKLKSFLRAGDDVAGAIFEAGFGSTSRVYEQIDGRIGMTPSAYRAGGKGEKIFYAVRKTLLGHLMMAATDRGVCFVHFGDQISELEAALGREYPEADLIRSSAEKGQELSLWVEALDNHLFHDGPRPNLPLHLNGTAFQIRVWRFLMNVREGDIASYTEVAKGIDTPKAVRAVANACAANNIAVLVPCHRVLRGDGSLGGYRWGAERKRVLIDSERGKCSGKAAQ